MVWVDVFVSVCMFRIHWGLEELSYALVLELQTVVRHCMGARNQTKILCKRSNCCWTLFHHSSRFFNRLYLKFMGKINVYFSSSFPLPWLYVLKCVFPCQFLSRYWSIDCFYSSYSCLNVLVFISSVHHTPGRWPGPGLTLGSALTPTALFFEGPLH